MQQNQEQQQQLGMRESFNLLYVLANCLAATVTPFTRRHFGTERPGVFGLAALVIILVYAGAARERLMIPYFWLWLFLIICHRVDALKRARRGQLCHTGYNGTPWAGPGGELVVLAIASVALAQWVSPRFGLFVGIGCGSVLLVGMIDAEIRRKRLEAMQNAEIETQYYAALRRGRRQDY